MAVYASDAEAHHLVTFYEASEVLKKRKNVVFHLVYKQGVSFSFYNISMVTKVWYIIEGIIDSLCIRPVSLLL